MDIAFDNPSHERLVNDFESLSRRFNGKSGGASTDIIATLNVLQAAPSLADVPRAFRPHPLKGGLKGAFAVDVDKAHRVIFQPDHEGDGNFQIDNYKTITSIKIIEIYKDYH